MEQHEISAVLSEAAQLHANLCAAIDRSLKAEYSPDGRPFNGASEAWSLASIRDALEVLEEQLECLQSLQCQQRAEKAATLAELEESQGILIRRLKQHHGTETAVVKEAFAFAGEPLQEKDDLPLHPSMVSEGLPDVALRHKITDGDKANNQDILPVMNLCREKMHKKGREGTHDMHRSPWNLLGGLKYKVLTFLSGRLTKFSAKFMLTVAGAAAVLVLSNAVYGRHACGRSHTSTEAGQRRTCPKKLTSVRIGVQRCVLMEPFKEEIRSVDVPCALG